MVEFLYRPRYEDFLIMMDTTKTPYDELTVEALLAEIEDNDQWLKEHSEQLAWAEENDEDSGFIDAIRHDMAIAAADYDWMRQSMWNRGYVFNNREDKWELKS